MSLGLLAWLTAAGWPEPPWPRTGSYQATSPTLRTDLIYDDDEIAREAERILSGDGGLKALYETLPLFAHPARLVTGPAWEWLSLWRQSQATGLPIARTLDEAPAHDVLAFELLDRETRAAGNWRANQKGTS
jgi:hypothetical protein